MNGCLASFFAVVLCGAAPLAAQDKPDFSGSWVLESGAQPVGDIPQALSISQLLARTNVRGEASEPFFKDITVTRLLETSTRSDTYQIGTLGGTLSSEANGIATHYHVSWEKQALVIERGTHTGPTRESGQWTERREVWSLESDGLLRLVITTRSSSESSTVMLIYRRR
jgi:hypothetical protein